MDTLDTEEAISHSRASIARSGYKHIHLFFLSLHADEVLQQSCHKPRPYVLKGEGRAMEEFQRIDIILDFHDRTVEGERVVDDVLQGIKIDILAKESTGHIVGYLLERHLVDVVEEHLWQCFNLFWHIKATILCQAFYHCFVQVGDRSVPVSTVIIHNECA